uniref:Transmembrane protein n=1 Tax=Rhizophora mucronata TaxID=61149 RepID=A0A2P2PZC0_RHIMU
MNFTLDLRCISLSILIGFLLASTFASLWLQEACALVAWGNCFFLFDPGFMLVVFVHLFC